MDHTDWKSIFNRRKVEKKEAKIKRMTLVANDMGFDDMWKRYFSKKLSISDCEDFASRFICKNDSKVKVIPLKDVDSTIDYDETAEDEKTVNTFLSRRK